MKADLRGKTVVEIGSILQKAGFKQFRAKQIFNWLYKHDIRDFDEMKNIPRPIINFLDENYNTGTIQIENILEADDKSKKILFTLKDGHHIESVLMPQDNRWTLCVSSQLGCKLNCEFCLTAKMGFIRNLSIAEILDQLQLTRRHFNFEINNIVFMGMGEPLLNLEALIPSIKLLTAPEGINIPSRRITVSTSGIIPGIVELGKADTGVNFAVSINSPMDHVRSRIMPINKKYPIKEVIKACKKFPLGQSRRLTFEYVMLKGINDSKKDAEKIVSLVHGIKCKINLICYNEDENLEFKATPVDDIEKFRIHLAEKGLITAIRYSKGQDIKAACGQLAADYTK
jgi:23S rRNA (adenine2503-C2)-methyltransferase